MPSVAVLFGSANLTTSLADVGAAVPASTDWNISTIRVANVHASTAATVDVLVTNGTTTVYLAKNINILSGASLNIIGPEKLAMPTGWKVQAKASATSSIDITVSGTLRSTL